MLSVLCLLTLFVPLCESLAKDNLSTGKAKHLYVQRTKPLRGSSSPIEVIYLNDDVSGSSEPSLERAHGSRSTQSQKHARRKRSVTGQPEVTKYLFNDTHNMLYVHWSGFNFSDTVVVLSRDIYPSSGSTSYLYVSNDYGKHYANDSKKLKYTAKDGTKKVGLIETFYNSPIHKRRYIFADTTNNVLFISKDDCKTLEAALLDFKPSEISFHSSKGEGLLAYDEDTEKLYYSNDFGFHWSSREDNVKSYFWGFEDVDNDDVVYLEIGNGTDLKCP